MATSGSVSTSAYNGRYARVDWSQSSSGNVSTISWVAYLVGGTNSWYITSQCYFDVSCAKGSANVGRVTILPYDTSRKGYVGQIGAGSFTITHDGNAEANFTIALAVATYTFAVNCTGSQSWDLPILFTACGAPSLSSISIVAPGGTFSVFITNGQGGANNGIVGYDIYFRIGAVPTTSAYDGYQAVTTSSPTATAFWTVPSSIDSARGLPIYVIARTKGSAGLSYYSGFTSLTGGIINRLPAVPTVSAGGTIVSNSTGYNCIATPGTDADTSQSVHVYYATSPTGTKTIYSSAININPNVGTSLSYYFWSYDGLEYSSSYATCIVTKNVKPIISSFDYAENPILYTALNSNGTSGYRMGWCNLLQPRITGSKTGTVSVVAQMVASDDTEITTSYSKIYNFPNFTLSSINQTNMDVCNLDIAVNNQYVTELASSSIKWRLKVVLNDGIENSDAAYYPANGYYFAVSKSPNLEVKYNQFSTSNIVGTISGNMYKQVRFKILDDTSLTNWVVNVKVGDNPYTCVITTNIEGNYRYIDVTLTNAPSGDSTITFNIIGSNTNISKTLSTTMKECLAPSMGNLTHGAPIIYPFTGTGSFDVSITNPFGVYTVLADALTAYECANTASDSIKVIHIKGITTVTKTTSGTINLDSGLNILYFPLDRSTIYEWSNELGITTYAGIQSYGVKLRITNLYGVTYESPVYNCTFNFNEVVTNASLLPTIDWSSDNSIWNSFNIASDKAQENLYLRFSIQCSIYTTDAMTFELYRKFANEDDTKYILKTSVSKTAAELTRATDRNAQSNTIQIVVGPLLEITSTSNIVWKVIIKNNSGSVTTTTQSTLALRHTIPTFSLNSCVVDDNYYLTYTGNLSENGGATSITYYLFGDSANITDGFVDISSGTIQCGSTYQDWEIKSICIHMVSIVVGLITNTKDYYSNYFMVYKLSPTVAYRKGYIGINTQSFEDDDVLAISGGPGVNANGRCLIRLVGVDWEGSINVVTGEIDGLTINGGTW